jgi:phospholipid-translocating ATPase
MSMTSLFRRNQAHHASSADNEIDEEDDQIDPELRLRTVRTASSAIAESIRSEQRRERLRAKRKRLWGSLKSKKPPSNAGHDAELRQDSSSSAASTFGGKLRRNVYVNCQLSSQDTDSHGRPLRVYVRNKVRTSSE